MSSNQQSHAQSDCGQRYKGHATAHEVIEREQLPGQLTNTVILITGATSGLGLEMARVLHYAGAHLFLAVRDLAKGRAVKSYIAGSGLEGRGEVDLLHVDLESLDSVRLCAAQFLSKSKQLNVLICNAGVLAPTDEKTEDGLETTFGVNHVAHFLLFQLLKAALLSSSTPSFNSRVVTLSSFGHCVSPIVLDDLDMRRRGYDALAQYGTTKTANVYMALEIERRYSSRGLHAIAVNPGATHTCLFRHLDAAILQTAVSDEWRSTLKTVGQGAATAVWAAVGKRWEGKGGKYLEDMREAQPVQPPPQPVGGHAPHTFDTEASKRLWLESLCLVGMTDSEDEQ